MTEFRVLVTTFEFECYIRGVIRKEIQIANTKVMPALKSYLSNFEIVIASPNILAGRAFNYGTNNAIIICT